MKKSVWERLYEFFYVALGLMIISTGIMYIFQMNIVPEVLIWKIVVVGSVLGFFLSFFYFGILGIISFFDFIKRGILNVKKYNGKGDFEEIDKFVKCYGENSEYYMNRIKAINYVYKKGKVAREYIKPESLDILYERKHYLEIQTSFYNEFTNVFISIGVSVLASVILKNEVLTTISILEIIIVFIAIIFGRYGFRGQAGSFGYNAYEFELGKIKDTIEVIEEKQLECTMIEYEAIKLKQDILILLMDLAGHKIRQKVLRIKKKEIEKSIEEVYALNLIEYVAMQGIIFENKKINGNYYRIPMIIDEGGSVTACDGNYARLLEIIEKYKL